MNALDVSLPNQNYAQPSKVTDAQNVKKQNSSKRQTKEKGKPRLIDGRSLTSSLENLSLSYYCVWDTSLQTPQSSEIENKKLWHLTDEIFSATKSGIYQGKSN